MKGYVGTMLRVNLSEDKIEKDSIENYPIYSTIGGRGLGAKLLYDMTDKSTDPLGEDNPLMFLTGPYTGTPTITPAFYNVTAKSPLTNTPTGAHSGGFWGPVLKRAGYDGIIVEGKSDKPVYICIENDKVEIKDSSNLWGKTVNETTDYFNEKYPGFKVSTIGPGGENLVRYAAIMNDKYRAVGRNGAGAVMGSKNLKSIIVKGNNKIEIADQPKLKGLLATALVNQKAKTTKLAKYGTPIIISLTNYFGALPTRNFQQSTFEGYEDVNPDKLINDFKKKDTGCFGCTIRCGKLNEVKDEDGELITEGPEYETLAMFSSNCGNNDLPTVLKANALCDDLGIDTISTGGSIAMSMELYQRGLINKEDTRGMDLEFGNRKAITDMIQNIAYRKELGDMLAEGTARIAEKVGKNAKDYAINVKGLEPPGYDPRGAIGTGLGFATSNRGACHLRAAMYAQELLFGTVDRLQTRGKEDFLIRLENLMSVIDSMVMCKFGCRYSYLDDPAVMGDVLTAVTGNEYSGDDILKTGERIWNIERIYLNREGYSSKDDTLPKRFFTEETEARDRASSKIDEKEFLQAIQDYYVARGWTTDGIPTDERLEKLEITR